MFETFRSLFGRIRHYREARRARIQIGALSAHLRRDIGWDGGREGSSRESGVWKP